MAQTNQNEQETLQQEQIIVLQRKQLEQMQQQLLALQKEHIALAKAHNALRAAHKHVTDSLLWKMTKPLRLLYEKARSVFWKVRFARLFFLGLESLKSQGFSYTWKKVKAKITRKKPQKELHENPSMDSSEYLKNKPQAEHLNARIAVHLHLYYVDLLPEFFAYLDRIPFPFDIFVSTKQGEDTRLIKAEFYKLKNVGKVTVKETRNRGRDIAPLYALFGEEISNYDYFLHIHSKKSLFTGDEQYGWRRYCLDCLLGSEEQIRKIFYLFENENIGLFFPETYKTMNCDVHTWLDNVQLGKQLAQILGFEFDSAFFNYPVGSFFWAKTEALRVLFDRHLTYEDFPEERGQTDGTLAHALERAIAPITKAAQYHLAIYDVSTDILNYDCSLRLYQNYFKLDADSVQEQLLDFEIISFSVFDTLITRAVLQREDLFSLLEQKIRKEYGLDLPFRQLRIQAKQCAWDRKKEFCTLDDIYYELALTAGLSAELAQHLKQMEINAELELCLPRRDMLQIFNALKASGKKLVLVEDTSLPSEVICKMLNKCGYTGWDEMWISNEKGASKDCDTIWDVLGVNCAAQNWIHVGTDPRGDILFPSNRKIKTFFLMDPMMAMKLSKFYPLVKPYMNTTAENSQLLGSLIHERLFNSPFAQGLDANPVMTEEERLEANRVFLELGKEIYD